MMKFYKYLYYRLYTWNLKKWGERDLPQFNALFGVSFMIILNIGILVGILDLFGFNFIRDETPKVGIVILGFLILGLNYFWLVKNEKYKRITKEFEMESKNKRLRNTLFLWLYLILSFVIVSYVATKSGEIKGLR